MTFKSGWFWYLLGVFLLALPGLISVDNRFYYFGVLGLGWISIVFALRQSGPTLPGTAIVLLLVTNLAFWLSYGLWKLRPHIVGPVQAEGTDPFGIAVAVWLIAIIICALYEIIILVRGISGTTQRYLSVVGLAGVVLQFPTTLRLIYSLIRGI
jgi:hypothetical protein